MVKAKFGSVLLDLQDKISDRKTRPDQTRPICLIFQSCLAPNMVITNILDTHLSGLAGSKFGCLTRWQLECIRESRI